LAVCASIATLGPAVAAAQTPDPHTVQPERPSVATHAFTVAPGWFEVEFGGQATWLEGEQQGQAFPLAAKIGLARRAQLTLSLTDARPADGNFGVDSFGAALKLRVADHLPVVGALAVQPSVTGSDMGTPTTGGILLISSNQFGPVTLDINGGYSWRGGDGTAAPRKETLWTASSALPLGPRVALGVEIFGLPPTAGPAGHENIVALLVGPTFTIRPWFTLDVSGIFGIAGPEPRGVSFGGVWNVGRIW